MKDNILVKYLPNYNKLFNNKQSNLYIQTQYIFKKQNYLFNNNYPTIFVLGKQKHPECGLLHIMI